jgi:hypothetical protein
MKRFTLLLLCALIALSILPAMAEQATPRDELIDSILAEAKKLYDDANGRLQKAHYAGDVYLCKNFTVAVFKADSDDFRMAEFPEVKLVIPDNLPREESKPYQYGIEWLDIKPEEGNPFYAAHQFKYDKELSKNENVEKAMAFMREVKRGDFFQMSAKYYYGVGAHSLIFTADYNPETDSVLWTDSNMKGEKRGGIRYGLPQYDAQKKIEWFVDAFCQPGRGATLYRLRDDIIRK